MTLVTATLNPTPRQLMPRLVIPTTHNPATDDPATDDTDFNSKPTIES